MAQEKSPIPLMRWALQKDCSRKNLLRVICEVEGQAEALDLETGFEERNQRNSLTLEVLQACSAEYLQSGIQTLLLVKVAVSLRWIVP